ncbi:MAG: lamin tail domain-containing protein, partial [bacterium]
MIKKIYQARLILLCLFLSSATTAQTITINEVMFDAVGIDDYDEFIELYNTGDSTAALNGMKLSVNGVTSGLEAVDSTDGFRLHSHAFALIMEKDYLLNHKSKTYDALIPDTTLLVIIPANFYNGTSGMNNSSPNDILLISPEGDTLSSVVTTPDQSSGFSDERIYPDGSDLSENWGNSRVLYGTPGFRNSISPLPFDMSLSVFRLITDPSLVDFGKSIELSLTVKNIGINICDSVLIRLGDDSDNDGVLDGSEITFSSIESINPRDSVTFQRAITLSQPGVHRLIAEADCSLDNDLGNNRRTLDPRIPFPLHCLAINEFMYCPSSGTGGEWVELLNVSADTVNLRYWMLSDNSTTVILTKTDFILPPDEFAVVANDSLFLRFWGNQPFFLKSCEPIPALNNTTDSIIIKDLCGRRIDALGYSKTWGYWTNVSLERKNPLILSSSPLNWTLSRSAEDATPGQPNSNLLENFDLQWDTLRTALKPNRLLSGDLLRLSFCLENNGIQTVTGYNVEIDYTADLNSPAYFFPLFEKIYSDSLRSLGKMLDSLAISLSFAGSGFLRCRILFDDDSVPDNNLLILPIYIGYTEKSVVINEIMYQPASGKSEWFELFNWSDSPVNLKEWSFKRSTTMIYVMTDSAVFIAPNSFAVITASENLGFDIPAGIPIVIPKKFPSLTNTADSVVIFDAVEHRIDALRYSSEWGSRTGVSLERIDHLLEGDISANWALSQSSTGGTPGRRNSVAIKDYDLAVSGAGMLDDTACPKPGSTADLYINIKNIGRETINDAEFYLGIDNNRDSVLQENEVLYVDVLTVGPGDSVVLYPRILVVKSGKNLIIGSVVSGDDDNENNTKYFLLNVLYPTGCMVINEFMYVPKTDFGGEWIELLNISEDTVNLANWRIGDNSSRVAISATDIMVPPSEYVLLSSTESITNYWEINGIYVHCKNSLPTLNNTEDSIVVRDLCGQVIDSLKYSSNWGYQQGVSLERIDPNRDSNVSGNWAMSQNSVGGTPGYMNSRMVKTHDLSIDTIYVVSEDMVHDEPVEFEFVVGNNGCADIGAYSIHLGVKPMTQEMNETAIIDTLLYFETTIKAGAHQKKSFFAESAPGGIYQVFCEVFLSGDEQSSNDQDSCVFVVGYPENSVVVNEVMNVPESGESEWFELYNTSDMDINLNRWTFRDAGGGWRTITTETEIITADGFCIVAAKQDFRQTYPQFSVNLIVPENFPILNNSSDSLFLADGSDRVIETVCFRQEWGGATGISIERKDPNAPALSEFNWGSSDDPAGATPGIENSILKYQYDLKIIPGSFLFVDSTVALIRPVSFQIGIINSGSQESNRFSLEVYYDVNGDNKASLGELVWSLHNIPPLLPDSTILLDGEIYSEKSGRCHYLAIVAMSDDENTKDNIITTDLLVASPKQSVVINEFLAYPNSDQVEFIELLHRGGDSINLNEWTLKNSRSAIGLSQPIMLESGKFLVLVRDSSFFEYNSVDNFQVIVPEKWPGLSNTADKIILRDLTGTVIDSLAYNDEWDIV